MLRVKPYSGGISCWTDSYRLMSGGSSYHETVAMLSLFGDRVSVRAIWAKVHNRGKKLDSLLEVGGKHLTVDEDMVTVHSTMGEDRLHLVMIHPAMTHQWSPFASWFMVAGRPEEAKVLFFNRLNRTCPVPFRPAWRETLWAIGREGKVIEELAGFGLPAFKVSASAEVWGPIVKKAIQDGSLS